MFARLFLPLVSIVIVSMIGFDVGRKELPRLLVQTPAVVALASPRASLAPPHLIASPAPLEIEARAFLALYLPPPGSGGERAVVVAHEAQTPLPLASVSKLMTALLMAESGELDRLVTIEASDLAGPADASLLRAGQTFRAADLLRSMLVESSNWSAAALARAVGGPDFVAQMNARARRLGMVNAHFVNPSGLDLEPATDLNFASAYDLALLAETILQNAPELWALTRAPESSLRDGAGHFHHLMVSTNKLLATPFGGAEIVGGKTGQTDLAKKNLLLVLRDQKSGSHLITVVLGADDHFAETKKLMDWLYQTYEF